MLHQHSPGGCLRFTIVQVVATLLGLPAATRPRAGARRWPRPRCRERRSSSRRRPRAPRSGSTISASRKSLCRRSRGWRGRRADAGSAHGAAGLRHPRAAARTVGSGGGPLRSKTGGFSPSPAVPRSSPSTQSRAGAQAVGPGCLGVQARDRGRAGLAGREPRGARVLSRRRSQHRRLQPRFSSPSRPHLRLALVWPGEVAKRHRRPAGPRMPARPTSWSGWPTCSASATPCPSTCPLSRRR